MPYVDGGRSWDGADCYGIGYLWHQAHGSFVPMHSGIRSSDAEFAYEVGRARSQWLIIDRQDLKPGDAVLLRKAETQDELHIGWFVEANYLMHSSDAAGVIFTGIDDQDIAHRTRGIYRYDPHR